MLEFHAPLSEGHRGIQATMNAKKMYLHWPSMKHAIEDHVSQCMMCQKLKYDRGNKLQGCYNLCWCLRIHGKVFQWTLLKSIQGNSGIWIIVACLRKQTYSLPVRKTSKAQYLIVWKMSNDAYKHDTSITFDELKEVITHA